MVASRCWQAPALQHACQRIDRSTDRHRTNHIGMNTLAPPHPLSIATVAGTAASQPAAQWLQWQQWCVEQGMAPDVMARLQAWTATAAADGSASSANAVPTGLVFWLPTPASASAAERALEQQVRSILLTASMAGSTTLRVVYGLPHQQTRLLREGMLEWLQSTQSASSTPAENAWMRSLRHGHLPSLRCRECADPDSEQKLFSSLLQKRAGIAPKS